MDDTPARKKHRKRLETGYYADGRQLPTRTWTGKKRKRRNNAVKITREDIEAAMKEYKGKITILTDTSEEISRSGNTVPLGFDGGDLVNVNYVPSNYKKMY